VLVVGEHIMQVDAECAARHLEEPCEQLHYLLWPVVGPQGATAGKVERTSSAKNCFCK
jgi:hypothetical protein